jgi:hypothetical protein
MYILLLRYRASGVYTNFDFSTFRRAVTGLR